MTSEQIILADLLRSRGHSVTKTRRAVLVSLIGRTPQSMAEILTKLPNVDRSSVYRTIDIFESLGIVSRIQIGWKYKLELSDKFRHHHHHITCNDCGAIVELAENKQVEHLLAGLAEQSGFTQVSHQMELIGLCAKCSPKK